ncbi:hypothetical protein AMS68_002013 [Peltaster fructicola]|uniref:Uncharacterized protein n=1 Tax=Peltaster fructicola TaxID=286661 RepID=A0A6H0XP87_9PEZI|nr:hypothetical protein AMS68_002013 [Peltaster fructicola]
MTKRCSDCGAKERLRGYDACPERATRRREEEEEEEEEEAEAAAAAAAAAAATTTTTITTTTTTAAAAAIITFLKNSGNILDLDHPLTAEAMRAVVLGECRARSKGKKRAAEDDA